jgi:hypothetical protein
VSTATLFEQTAAHDHPADAPLSKSEQARIDATLALIPPGINTALDVGCGPGTLLVRLPMPQAFGTDLGWVGLRRARTHRPVLRSSILSCPSLTAPSTWSPAAKCWNTSIPKDVSAAMTELWRVARHAVLITVPYKENLLESSTRCPKCRHEFHLHGPPAVFR